MSNRLVRPKKAMAGSSKPRHRWGVRDESVYQQGEVQWIGRYQVGVGA